MYLRVGLFMFDLIFGGSALSYMGISKIPFYLSPLGVLLSIITEFLLLLSHFRTYDPKYDSLVKAMFEVSTLVQTLITVFYWSLLYNSSRYTFKSLRDW